MALSRPARRGPLADGPTGIPDPIAGPDGRRRRGPPAAPVGHRSPARRPRDGSPTRGAPTGIPSGASPGPVPPGRTSAPRWTATRPSALTSHPGTKKPPGRAALEVKTGGDLLSQAVAHQVPSALRGLTALFGMGRGVSPSL